MKKRVLYECTVCDYVTIVEVIKDSPCPHIFFRRKIRCPGGCSRREGRRRLHLHHHGNHDELRDDHAGPQTEDEGEERGADATLIQGKGVPGGLSCVHGRQNMNLRRVCT